MNESTNAIVNEIRNAGDDWEKMENILDNLPKTLFVDRLKHYFKVKNKRPGEIQIETNISSSMFYAICNGTRKATKAHIIQIALFLGLDENELNELLKLAGHKELYPKIVDDAIVIFGLQNKKSVFEIEELLNSKNCKLTFSEKDDPNAFRK